MPDLAFGFVHKRSGNEINYNSVGRRDLRLQYTFRSAIFFKFRFFDESNDPNEISNVKKKSLKKINYNIASRAAQSNSVYVSVLQIAIVLADGVSKSLCQKFFFRASSHC